MESSSGNSGGRITGRPGWIGTPGGREPVRPQHAASDVPTPDSYPDSYPDGYPDGYAGSYPLLAAMHGAEIRDLLTSIHADVHAAVRRRSPLSAWRLAGAVFFGVLMAIACLIIAILIGLLVTAEIEDNGKTPDDKPGINFGTVA